MTDQTPQQPSPQVPPVPQQPAPPPKKGLSPLAWVAIGCGALLILGCLALVAAGWFLLDWGRDAAREMGQDPAMAAAETLVRMNPELELVESDRAADTLTIRNKRTGEELTVDLADVQRGEIGFRSAEGETRLEMSGEEAGGVRVTRDGQETFRLGGGAATDLPEWLPVYPGTEPATLYSSSEGATRTGAYTATTADSADAALDWFRAALEEAGLTVRGTDLSVAGGQEGEVAGTLQAQAEDGRSATVMAVRTGGETRLSVSFESPR